MSDETIQPFLTLKVSTEVGDAQTESEKSLMTIVASVVSEIVPLKEVNINEPSTAPLQVVDP